MHAVAVEKEHSVATENGSTKVTKKKSKNNRKQQGQKSADTASPPAEIHDAKSLQKVNNCTNNGPVTVLVDSAFSRIEANGCAENHSHHDDENGELPDVGSKKQSRNKNQKKKHQKTLRNSIEDGTENNDKEPSSVCDNSDQLISNNNNTIDKFQSIDKNGSMANGTDNCPVPSTERNRVNDVKDTTPLSSSSPNSKTMHSQSPSSSPSTDPSSVSSSSTQRLMISLDSSAASSSSPPPAASSNHEQISNKRSEHLGSDEDSKKDNQPPTMSPATQPAFVPPIGEDGAVGGVDRSDVVIKYKQYESELQMQDIMRLIQSELSEPYSIYTYRYFIYNWPKLCFLAAHGDEYVGAIVCKLDMHMNVKRGYIAMLAVKKEYRKLKIGTTLVEKAIEAMLFDDADEVVLETEMKNTPALRLYENLGFVRDKRLFRYYLNGVDALRLKLWFR